MSTSTSTIHEVSPVRHDHVPNWFRLRMLRMLRNVEANIGLTSGRSVLLHAIGVCNGYVRCQCDQQGGEPYFMPRWLDHWGSTKIDGVVCFVAEPYLKYPPTMRDFYVPHCLAYCTNCQLQVLPHSEWGQETIRLLFRPNED